MMISGIYAIVCQEADRLYVGSALNFPKRIWQHRTNLRCGVHPNTHLQRLYDKYGFEGLRFIELERVFRSTDLLIREQAWLDAMFKTVPDKVVNFQRKAGSNLGRRWKMRPEAAAKAASARVGLKRSAETRAKMSEAQKGRKLTDEHRAKLSEAAFARYNYL